MATDPAASGRWRPRTRRRRVALAVWAGVGTFVVLLVLDGLWAGRALVRGLTGARSELQIAIESLVTGDPGAARPHFEAARSAAEDALGATGHPSFGIAGLVPIAGENIDAAAAVAEASRSTAEAGAAMVRLAGDLGWSDIRIPAATTAGRLDVDRIAGAIPAMEAVSLQLRDALTALDAIGGDGLFGPVATGYRDAVEGLTRRTDLARRFLESMRLVHTMFAGEHRYLVIVPSLGLPRPGGGRPAAVGVLSVGDGVLELEPLAPAPPALEDATITLDWPSTARRLITAAEEAGIVSIDGVIQIDAAALQDLVWTAGDVIVDKRSEPLNDATTTTALEIDAFLGNSPLRTARLHAAWASSILTSFFERRPALETFALAMAADARGRHLMLYVPGREPRRLLRALGLDGRSRLGGKRVLPVAATWSALGSAHVGALVESTVRQSITVRPNGSAVVETEVVFENGAGTEPPSVLLGRPVGGQPIGSFLADVTCYLPGAARRIDAETSRPSPIRIGEERGLATVTGSIAVRAGDTTTMTVRYVVDDVIRRAGDGREVVLRLLPQPTIAGVRYQLRITLPEGSTVVSATPGLRGRGDTATFARTQTGPADLELRFVPALS